MAPKELTTLSSRYLTARAVLRNHFLEEASVIGRVHGTVVYLTAARWLLGHS